jgi:hypothetical protein
MVPDNTNSPRAERSAHLNWSLAEATPARALESKDPAFWAGGNVNRTVLNANKNN